jgi:hypothetical protein
MTNRPRPDWRHGPYRPHYWQVALPLAIVLWVWLQLAT